MLSSKVIMALRDRDHQKRIPWKGGVENQSSRDGGKVEHNERNQREKNMGNCGEAPAFASSRKGLI